jgi:hypothetical protein
MAVVGAVRLRQPAVPVEATTIDWASIVLPMTPPDELAALIRIGEMPSCLKCHNGNAALGGLAVPDRYRESRLLIVLERDLLRQHDVTPGKISLRPKAPSGHLRAALIELIDVHHLVVPDAVAFAGA